MKDETETVREKKNCEEEEKAKKQCIQTCDQSVTKLIAGYCMRIYSFNLKSISHWIQKYAQFELI